MFVSAICLLILGILLLFYPDFVYKYYQGTINYEAFFNDYWWMRYIIAPLFFVIGVLFVIVAYRRKHGNILIRQVSTNIIGEGNNKLTYPFLATFFSTNTIDIGTPKRENIHMESFKDVEKNITTMRAILERTDIKSIAYLGADYIPYIVEFGVLLNQCSLKVKLYHNFIKGDSSKVKQLRSIFCKEKITLAKKEFKSDSKLKEVVVCVESSQCFDLTSLPSKLKGMDKVILRTSEIGRSAITNIKDINSISTNIVNEIGNLCDNYNKIHLLLCCSSCLCFSIGRKLRINELKPILVYDYDRAKGETRPWNIQLTK